VQVKPVWIALEHVRSFLRSRDRATESHYAPELGASLPQLADEGGALPWEPIVMARAKDAIAALSVVDGQFGTLTAVQLVELLADVDHEMRRGRGHKGPAFGLALLALECGALGAKVRPPSKAGVETKEQAVGRLAGEYTKAWSQSWKPRKRLRNKTSS
jgi:hypothetical protein